jgi:hypothetical protein
LLDLNLKVGRGKKPSKNVFAFVVVVDEKTKDAIQNRAFATNDNCVL